MFIITVVDPNTDETIDADIQHDRREAERLYKQWKSQYEPFYKVTIGVS